MPAMDVAPGLKLRRARKAQRPSPSQYEVADMVGVKRSTYGAWESGRNQPDPRVVRRLARQWGIDEDWFWDQKDSPVPVANLQPVDPEGTVRVAYWGEIPSTGWEVPVQPASIAISGAVSEPDTVVAVRVVGDAYVPHFHHNQVVVVRRRPPAEGLVHLCKGPGGHLELLTLRGEELVSVKKESYPVADWEILGMVVHAEYSDPFGFRGWGA